MRQAAIFILLALPLWLTAAEPDHDFFEKRIRPVLVERCYQCHSLSAGKEKGGLRVDSRESLLAGGGTGPAVVPGDPDKSLLVQAIRHKDPDTAMPPKGGALPAEAVKDFESWVRHGAVFPAALAALKKSPLEHWAYQPVKAVRAPEVKDAAWPRSDSDRFLLAKMEAAGVKPGPDAAPEALARRMAYFITGLPPSPEDVQSFLAAYAQDARAATAAFADKMLASPHYGERWARHWMDLVRYADGKGNEYDIEIEGAWRYRDYLVRAFNADVPYDQFVREQIAGDLIPARRDPATGRNESLLGTAWWNLGEGATSPVDLPNDEADRLDNQVEVFGKTFNALTLGCARCHDHKFDPISMKEYYGVFGTVAASPTIRAWSNDQDFEKAAAGLRPLRARAVKNASAAEPVTIEPYKAADAGQKILADFAQGIPGDWTLSGHADVVNGATAAEFGLAPGLWSGTLSKKLPAMVRSQQHVLEHDYVDVLAAGDDATIQVVVANFQMIRSPLYDGLKKGIRGGAQAWKWYRFNVARWKGLRVHVEILSGKVHDTEKFLNTTDTANSQFGVRAVLFNNGAQLPLAKSGCELGLAPPQTDEALTAEIAAIEKTIPAPERFLAIGETAGRDVQIYARGDASKPRTDTAPRKYLAACGNKEAVQAGSGRRELAEALLSPANPLTARVAVNRLWHHLFGRGLVTTVDNFGLLGEAPSHPELLDALATRFAGEQRWSVKAFVREIVLSHAWQLASGPAPTADADNKLLSRYPLRRLEGEAIRDSVFAVAGTLDRTFGGPCINVPHRLAEAGSGQAPPSGPVDGARRRSLYVASRRNYPNTFLDVFDKPSMTNTFGRRDTSNVPIQALTLLNDPMVLGAAKAWADRIRKSGLAPEARIERMYREAFARGPSPEEIQATLALVNGTDKGWDDLALTLFNLKEFIYVR